MDSLAYDSTASVRRLLDSGFELPIHFAAVGTNGSVVAGTFSRVGQGHELDCSITVETGDQGLTAPINIMYVDRKGLSALVVVRRTEDESARDWPVS